MRSFTITLSIYLNYVLKGVFKICLMELSIIQSYGGGPVGAETLAISIGESIDTLEDYYEPYLIQCGLLQRTPRGRIVTEKAYRHLGLPFRPSDSSPESSGGQARLLF